MEAAVLIPLIIQLLGLGLKLADVVMKDPQTPEEMKVQLAAASESVTAAVQRVQSVEIREV